MKRLNNFFIYFLLAVKLKCTGALAADFLFVREKGQNTPVMTARVFSVKAHSVFLLLTANVNFKKEKIECGFLC